MPDCTVTNCFRRFSGSKRKELYCDPKIHLQTYLVMTNIIIRD